MSNIKDLVKTNGAITSWYEGEEQFTVTRNASGKPVTITSVRGRWPSQECEFLYDGLGAFLGVTGDLKSNLLGSITSEAIGTLAQFYTNSNNNTVLVGADKTFPMRRGDNALTYMALGDSKTAQGVVGQVSGFRTYNRGYWNRAINLTGLPFELVSVSATGGWKVADMLAGLTSHIGLYGAPGYVLFYGGVNDLYVTAGTATSVATYKETIEAIYAMCNLHCIKVVRVGIPPEGTSAGAFYTKTLIATVKRLNEWDRDLCASYGFRFVDPWRADIHGQPLDAAGNAITANYYDTLVHESHSGAYLLAKAVAAELVTLTGISNPRNSLANSYVDAVILSKKTITSITGTGTTATATLTDHQFDIGDDVVVWSSSNTAENAKDYYGVKRVTARTQNTFSYACTDSSATTGTLYASTGRNHIENSMQTGTTGTKTVVTGDVSDGFTCSATAGMTVAATKEVHTKWSAAPGSTTASDGDGLGYWQKFAVTSAAAGDSLAYKYQVPDPLALRGGENYVVECEVEIYGTISNLRGIHLYQQLSYTATGSAPTQKDLRDGWDGTNNENDSTEARKFVLRTQVWNPYIKAYTTLTSDTLYPSGTFGWNSSSWPEFIVSAEFSGVGGCDIRIGLPRLIRVD